MRRWITPQLRARGSLVAGLFKLNPNERLFLAGVAAILLIGLVVNHCHQTRAGDRPVAKGKALPEARR